MPTTKEAEKPFALKNWRPIVAVASVMVILSGLSVVATEQYNQGQLAAAAAAESALELGQQRVEEVSTRLADLELAIRNAEDIANQSDGQTLEESEREALLAEIEDSKDIWVEQKTLLLELEAAVKALRGEADKGNISGSVLAGLIQTVTEAYRANWEQIVTQISAIGEKISSVQTAQANFQQEMQRLAEEEAAAQAAEAAERIAKAKTITPVSTLTDTGGATAPSAPAPPPVTQEVLVAPVQPGTTPRAFIESYVLALAPNSFISWVPSLCNGFYVCGRAWVGGVNATPVKIELDPALENIYMNSVGLSVLVHEAAHARQWLKYGPNIISANESYTGLTGTAAVEYMADCATIVKYGRSTGVYTNQCSESELAAAATIW